MTRSGGSRWKQATTPYRNERGHTFCCWNTKNGEFWSPAFVVARVLRWCAQATTGSTHTITDYKTKLPRIVPDHSHEWADYNLCVCTLPPNISAATLPRAKEWVDEFGADSHFEVDYSQLNGGNEVTPRTTAIREALCTDADGGGGLIRELVDVVIGYSYEPKSTDFGVLKLRAGVTAPPAYPTELRS